MKRLLLATLLLTSCATIRDVQRQDEAGSRIKRTSNPEATRGCRLLGQLPGVNDVNFEAGAWGGYYDTRELLIFPASESSAGRNLSMRAVIGSAAPPIALDHALRDLKSLRDPIDNLARRFIKTSLTQHPIFKPAPLLFFSAFM